MKRPKVKVKSGWYAGLTPREIRAWIERVSFVRAARDLNLFCPENRRWRGA